MTRTKPLRRTPMRRKRKPSRVTKDGRVILGSRDYATYRREVWDAQHHQCGKCRIGIALWQMELHHIEGRGMAGGKRDDRKVVGLCHNCHVEETPQPQWSKHG